MAAAATAATNATATASDEVVTQPATAVPTAPWESCVASAHHRRCPASPLPQHREGVRQCATTARRRRDRDRRLSHRRRDVHAADCCSCGRQRDRVDAPAPPPSLGHARASRTRPPGDSMAAAPAAAVMTATAVAHADYRCWTKRRRRCDVEPCLQWRCHDVHAPAHRRGAAACRATLLTKVPLSGPRPRVHRPSR